MVTNTDQQSGSAVRDALMLATVTALTLALVAGVAHLTRAPIERNRHAGLMRQIDALLPRTRYDNDLLFDRVSMTAPDLLDTSQPLTALRARSRGAPVAAILLPPAVQGYGGPVQLMVGVTYEGELLGVQVLAHRETPGIGDAFERTDWLQQFRGKSLTDPPQGQWGVRADGGAFDQFTGATITPRAIVSAVRRTLEFYRSRHERVFALPSEATP